MTSPTYLFIEKHAVKTTDFDSKDDLINHDLDHAKFFIKQHTKGIDIIKQPSIQHNPINRAIYFKPSYCPLVSVNDYLEGTCFQDLLIPTGSFKFELQDQAVTVSTVEKNLDLNRYIGILDQRIKTRIKSIYSQHPVVNLCYSGGIDSMVLLSAIIELDLLAQTRIIVFENFTQTHFSCLHINQDQKNKVTDLLDSIATRCLEIRWHQISMEDLAAAFNHGDLADIKCFSTYTLLKQYQNQVFIFGHHGNQIFLHKNMFFDEILLQQPSWTHKIESYISNMSGYYTASAQQYRVPTDLVGIERRHFLAKPWEKYNGFNRNKIYAPIADDADFLMLRSLDFGQIHPDVILQAKVAVELIQANTKGDISDFLGIESTRDNDALDSVNIPADMISADSLYIPHNLHHDPQGLDYIKNEIKEIPNKKFLAINSAVSIKSLQHIAHTYK